MQFDKTKIKKIEIVTKSSPVMKPDTPTRSFNSLQEPKLPPKKSHQKPVMSTMNVSIPLELKLLLGNVSGYSTSQVVTWLAATAFDIDPQTLKKTK